MTLEQIKKAIVKIEINGNLSGTGFFIAQNVVLTNAHVIGKADAAQIAVSGKPCKKILFKQQDKNSDFAILQCDCIADYVVPVSFDFKPAVSNQQKGRVFGFGNEFFDEPTAFDAVILNVYDGKKYELQLDMNMRHVLPGDSGSPFIVDDVVVGLIFARRTTDTTKAYVYMLSDLGKVKEYAEKVFEYYKKNKNSYLIASQISELRGRIMATLDNPLITDEQRKRLEELAQKALPQNEVQYTELIVEFANIEAAIKNKDNEDTQKKQFVIWLDREKQKNDYYSQIRTGTETPFIFGLVGKYEDKTDYASLTLQEYHFSKLLRINNDQFILKKRIEQGFDLSKKENIENIYDAILREVLDIGIYGAETDELPDLLEKEYGDRHIFVICSVVKWTEEGLFEFVEFFRKIKRNLRRPFILMLEFDNHDFNALSDVFSKFYDKNYKAFLLPELEKVQYNEIVNFWKEYSDKFYESSLRPEEAPIFYKNAIEKLKLKPIKF